MGKPSLKPTTQSPQPTAQSPQPLNLRIQKGIEPLHIGIRVRQASTGVPLAEVGVEMNVKDGPDFHILTTARTGPDGVAVLDLDPALWRRELTVRAAGDDSAGVPISRAVLNGSEDVVLDVAGDGPIDRQEL